MCHLNWLKARLTTATRVAQAPGSPPRAVFVRWGGGTGVPAARGVRAVGWRHRGPRRARCSRGGVEAQLLPVLKRLF